MRKYSWLAFMGVSTIGCSVQVQERTDEDALTLIEVENASFETEMMVDEPECPVCADPTAPSWKQFINGYSSDATECYVEKGNYGAVAQARNMFESNLSRIKAACDREDGIPLVGEKVYNNGRPNSATECIPGPNHFIKQCMTCCDSWTKPVEEPALVDPKTICTNGTGPIGFVLTGTGDTCAAAEAAARKTLNDQIKNGKNIDGKAVCPGYPDTSGVTPIATYVIDCTPSKDGKSFTANVDMMLVCCPNDAVKKDTRR